jgi:hypothetical protein
MRITLIAGCLAVALSIGGCSKSSTPSGSSTSNSASPSSSSSPNSSSQPSSAANQPAPAAAPAAPPPPPPPPPVTIPTGTQFTIALDNTIDTKTANNGDRFTAILAAPITVGGNLVLPTNTRVSGTIVTAQSAGKVKGSAILALTLDTIRLNGNPYSVQTSEFEDAGKGRGKRTAVGAGGGAAFGAIVGALAGGGKGAAIGALAGGGAGTAGAAFTGKKDISLPAETRLHFRLTAPVTIQGTDVPAPASAAAAAPAPAPAQ